MNDFIKKLKSEIDLFSSNEFDLDIIGDKYAFLGYIFSNIESIDFNEMTYCPEEFEQLGINIDGAYFDFDYNIYNLYLVIYNANLNEELEISPEDLNKEYNKIYNFLKLIFLKKIKDIDSDSLTYDIACNLREQLEKDCSITVNIYSNYKISNKLQKNNIEKIYNKNVLFKTYDIEDLKMIFNKINEDSSEINCIDKFGENIKALLISRTNDFDVYMCSMKGSWLSQLYLNDGQRLLQQNCRAYLKPTAKVNSGIIKTVEECPERFVIYNNGLSAIAIGLDCIPIDNNYVSIKSIKNLQIVNGGQTTATLSIASRNSINDNLSNVIVPVKLTVVKNKINESNLISSISIFSNTQTQIKQSDHPSNLNYYFKIKELSSLCLSEKDNQSYSCYFERLNGEYFTDQLNSDNKKAFKLSNPKEMKFNKIELAIVINCWQQKPHIVNLGREKNFLDFNEIIKKQISLPDEEYFKNAYALIILYRDLDKLCKKNKISLKINVITYAISLLSYISNMCLDLDYIWQNKHISKDLEDLMPHVFKKIHDIIMNAPSSCSEPRMWARKEQCWEKVKQLKFQLGKNHLSKKIVFFEKNEALAFISDEKNISSQSLWLKLLMWDQKFKVLDISQQKKVKMASSGKALISAKNKNDLVDIFIYAVKHNFNYK